MKPKTRKVGFTIIWLGQLISLIGTGFTDFSLAIWVFEQTGQASPLAITLLCSFAPSIFFSAFAGVIVDRFNRKNILIITNTIDGIISLIIMLLYIVKLLDIWHLYLLTFISGICTAFQFPAYLASITFLLPKSQYGRASGLISFAESLPRVLAPFLGAVFLKLIGVPGILSFDIITYLIVLIALFNVHIPQPKKENQSDNKNYSYRQDLIYGFKYMTDRSSLLWLQIIFATFNFLIGFSSGCLTAMILLKTNNNQETLSFVLSFGAIGGVIGSIVASVWKGTKRKIDGLLGGTIISNVGRLIVGIEGDAFTWLSGIFVLQFFTQIANSSNQAIWQSKVAPTIQGRIFAIRRLIAQSSYPIGLILAGYSADHLFEPAFSQKSILSEIFAPVVGTKPGSGIGLMFVMAGSLGIAIGIAAYFINNIRNVEEILPDCVD